MRLKHLLFLLLFISCDSTKDLPKTQVYFDTKTEIEKIIEFNNGLKPIVNKVWVYNEDKEIKLVSDIDWDKELKLFIEADINKSSYVSSYDSIRTENRIVYKLKENEKLPLKELSVGIDSLGKLTSMRSERSSKNYFFNMGSIIEINLENGKLKSYVITSTQKLLWLKADSIKVIGTIN